MKLSFNTWAYASFPFWMPAYTLEDTITRLARMGYDAVELGGGAPHAYPAYLDAQRRKETVDLLHKEGIVVSSICPALGGGPGYNPGSPYDVERKASVQYYKDVVALAKDLESKAVIYVAGWSVHGTERAQAWEWSRNVLREVASFANEIGVTMMVEPTPADTNIVESADDALRMMREVESPAVKVMFDTIHAMYRGESWVDYVYTMGKDLGHVHITDKDRLAPGAGGTDFAPLIKALRDVGFDGFLTQECGFMPGTDPDAVAKEGLKNLKALLAE